MVLLTTSPFMAMLAAAQQDIAETGEMQMTTLMDLLVTAAAAVLGVTEAASPLPVVAVEAVLAFSARVQTERAALALAAAVADLAVATEVVVQLEVMADSMAEAVGSDPTETLETAQAAPFASFGVQAEHSHPQILPTYDSEL